MAIGDLVVCLRGNHSSRFDRLASPFVESVAHLNCEEAEEAVGVEVVCECITILCKSVFISKI